jgi:hypothetical protein
MATTLMVTPASVLRSRTPARLYVYDTLLERLPQDLQDMAAALGPFIQEAHAMVGQRHLARHRDVAAADQPRIREGLVGRPTRAGCDSRCVVDGEARDAEDVRGLKGFCQGHGWQDGGESPRQDRRARLPPAEKAQVIGQSPGRSWTVPSRVHLVSDQNRDQGLNLRVGPREGPSWTPVLGLPSPPVAQGWNGRTMPRHGPPPSGVRLGEGRLAKRAGESL